MLKRALVCFLVLSFAVGTILPAAPLFEASQTPSGGNNPDDRQAHPPQKLAPQAAIVITRDTDVLCLAISPDGGTLAAGCTDRFVRLLAPFSGEERISIEGVSKGYVRGVAFVPPGNTVAAIGDDIHLRLWDTASGKLLKTFPALGAAETAGIRQFFPNALAVSSDGRLIAVGGGGTADGSGEVRLDDNTVFEIRVRDLKTGEIVWSHLGRRAFMNQLAFSPDGSTLASAATGEVMLWNAKAGGLKRSLKPASATVWAIAFSPDGNLLAGYGNALVKGKQVCWLTMWDLRSGEIIHSFQAGESIPVTAPGTLVFSPDGKSLASAGVTIAERVVSFGGRNARAQTVVNHIKLWNVATGKMTWTSAEGEIGSVAAVVFAPNGLSLYCCDASALVRIDARTGQTRKLLMKAGDAQPR
jgi:WD40 repeat protein